MLTMHYYNILFIVCIGEFQRIGTEMAALIRIVHSALRFAGDA